MPKLSHQIQTFIVLRLAQFATPTEVVDMVKEEFNLTIIKQTVHHYDPDHGQPAPKWRTLYAEERERFRRETDKIGVGNLAFRLQRLDRMARRAEKSGKLPIARDLIETAAKDAGGAFTNKKGVAVGVGSMDQMLAALDLEESPDGDADT